MKDDQDLVESLLVHDDDVAVPADHDRRIREGLGALLGAVPSAPDAPDAPPPAAPRASELAGGVARRWLTTGIVAIAAAGGGFAIGRSTAPGAASIAPPVTSASASAAAPPASASAVALPISAAPEAAAPTASASAPLLTPAPSASIAGSVLPAPGPAGDAFDREQSLLERARSALVRHDADAAAAALSEHERQFPRTRHAEERDYLRIQVLRERGDAEGARERAEAFLAKYPDSMLRARVEPLAE
ncbi:MAG: hypothetical protein KF850_19040 [Labilithrix sp.]|nr:hypothetical protein [Labilithrix sp.]